MPQKENNSGQDAANVGVFVTCLVDLFRPSIGFATVKLLQEAGCRVSVPRAQTCCGQPAWNSGDRRHTTELARQVISAFEAFDYVVVPSGSCAGMIRDGYTALFAKGEPWGERARALAKKTYELNAFLVDVLDASVNPPAFEGTATYHDACTGLRNLGIRNQPRKLLAGVPGLTLTEMADTEVCCGFGGTFCVKYPEVSERMVTDKLENARRTEAQWLLAGELGCLLNIAGRARRLGASLRCRHMAEVLAGELSEPPIGEGGAE